MHIRHAIAAVGLGLFALFGMARAADMRDASHECVECHDEEDLPDMSRGPHALPGKKPPMAAAADKLAKRPMGDTAQPGSPTCITCHGPSDLHNRNPDKTKIRPPVDRSFGKKTPASADERSGVCLDCHQKDAKRMLWGGSQHQSADLACNSCHKVHTNRDRLLAKATQADVCVACHKEQRAQFSRASRHPIPEGKMTCSDCHNVHGSAGPKLAKHDSTNTTCYTCHAEKRGPFVHQHDPVTDDCANCHNPHGSSVAGMLKARAPMLCQQCHTPHVAGGVGAVGGQPGVFGNAQPGQTAPQITVISSGKNVVNLWQGRSCMNCHTQVHGSNNPSATNPTPQLMQR
ncbi:DmsE family decaheme c-type cytochrome [Ideonella sp. A 288]|uniref:DmsE family decaheme c-type cytochrome n=1 Tax=Ideonella sp. A 288 TaxID=1962181 RepID=UPI000B4B1716|nr:DmsE family decaheme c-type cytochrome [Ideonella sp. A 288]